MSHDAATLTEDEFNARFGVRAIHLRLAKYDAEIGINELRARDAEERFIRRYGSRHIWTLVEIRSGELYIFSGFHLVNHLGLIASLRPRPMGFTISVRVDDGVRKESPLSEREFRPHF